MKRVPNEPRRIAYAALKSNRLAQFRDVTQQSGVTFRHTDGSSGRHDIVEYVSAGLAWFDYDRDGDGTFTDIFVSNGVLG